MSNPQLLAKCEEMLAFLAAHDEHSKLRTLAEDIAALRDRLLREAEAEQRSPS
jgi:hypothetical protein